MEELPQADAKAWKIGIRFPSTNILSASRHKVTEKSLGEEGREGQMDSEAPRPGQRGGNQGDKQMVSDSCRETPSCSKVCWKKSLLKKLN